MKDFYSDNRIDIRGADFGKADAEDESQCDRAKVDKDHTQRDLTPVQDDPAARKAKLLAGAHATGLIPLMVTARANKLMRTCPWLRFVRAGDTGTSALAINPFEILNGVDIRRHLEQLVLIFSGLFSFTQEVTALFRCTLKLAYQRRGWNLLNGKNWRLEGVQDYSPELHPDFVDLQAALEDAVDMCNLPPFAAVNAEGKLRALTGALTSGLMGQTFARRTAVSINELFLEGTVVDVSLVGEANRGRSLAESLLMLFFTEIYGEEERQSTDKALFLLDLDDFSIPTLKLRKEEHIWFFAQSRKCTDNGSTVLISGDAQTEDLPDFATASDIPTEPQKRRFFPFSIPQSISHGQGYYPEAFAPEVLEIGTHVADQWQLRDCFVRYLLKIDADFTQLVHGRPDIIREVQRLTLRAPVPLSAVTWCAVSLVTDRYFAQRAAFYSWTSNQEQKLRTDWYEIMSLAFLPGGPRRLEKSTIEAWLRALAEASKVEQGPLVSCGPCTRKCTFGFDAKLLLSDRKILFDFSSSLRNTKQPSFEKAAWFAHVIAERVAGEKSADNHLALSYCIAAHLSAEQQYSSDAQLTFCHKVRERLEAGDFSNDEGPGRGESIVTIKSVEAES
ncbi:MAG: hypothetical protein K2W95_12900 [Candidatus Obscuribacterales bacterium]|nr:hypothetical protein [Candidatus Obscuribacterales bacterium]